MNKTIRLLLLFPLLMSCNDVPVSNYEIVTGKRVDSQRVIKEDGYYRLKHTTWVLTTKSDLGIIDSENVYKMTYDAVNIGDTIRVKP